VELAGGLTTVVARGWALLDAGGMAVAAHLDEWATRSAPDDRAAMNDARRALGEEPS
jgi:hypothetical protein